MGAGGKLEHCHFLGARRHRSAVSFSLFAIKASFAFWILFLSLNVFDSRYHLCVAADVVNGGVENPSSIRSTAEAIAAQSDASTTPDAKNSSSQPANTGNDTSQNSFASPGNSLEKPTPTPARLESNGPSVSTVTSSLPASTEARTSTNVNQNTTSSTSSRSSETLKNVTSTSTQKPTSKKKKRPRIIATPTEVDDTRMNYAAKSAGAVIIDSSKDFKYVGNILDDVESNYALVPCASKHKYVTIGLSEDSQVDGISLKNAEAYSGTMTDVQVLGSAKYPTKQWTLLGEINVENNNNKQSFKLPRPAWINFVKLRFRSHYGDEFYCTLTRVIINGQSMMDAVQKTLDEASFVDEDEAESRLDDDDQEADSSEGRISSTSVSTHSTTRVANNDNIPSTTTTTQQNRITETDDLEQDEGNEKSLQDNNGKPGETSDTTNIINNQANGDATEAERRASTTQKIRTDLKQNSGEVEVEGNGRAIPIKDRDGANQNVAMELKGGDGITVDGGSVKDLKGSDSNSQKHATPDNSSSTMSTGEGQRAQNGLESLQNKNQSNNLENRVGRIERDEGNIRNGGATETVANSDESISNHAFEEGTKKNHSKGKVEPDRSSNKGGINDRSRGKTTADTVTSSAIGKPVVVDSIEDPMQQSNENIISTDTHNKGKDAKVESQKGAAVGSKHKNVNHDSQAKSKRIENSSNTNKAMPSKMERASKMGGNSPQSHGRGSKDGAMKKTDIPSHGYDAQKTKLARDVEKKSFNSLLPVPPTLESKHKKIDLPRSGAQIENIFSTLSKKVSYVEKDERQLRRNLIDSTIGYNAIMNNFNDKFLDMRDRLMLYTIRTKLAEEKALDMEKNIEVLETWCKILSFSLVLVMALHLYLLRRRKKDSDALLMLVDNVQDLREV